MVNRITLKYPGGKQQREDDVLDTVWKIPVNFFKNDLCPKSRYNHRSIRKSHQPCHWWELSNWRLPDLLIRSEKVHDLVQKILWSLWQVRSHTERQESSSPTKSHFWWIWTQCRRNLIYLDWRSPKISVDQFWCQAENSSSNQCVMFTGAGVCVETRSQTWRLESCSGWKDIFVWSWNMVCHNGT